MGCTLSWCGGFPPKQPNMQRSLPLYGVPSLISCYTLHPFRDQPLLWAWLLSCFGALPSSSLLSPLGCWCWSFLLLYGCRLVRCCGCCLAASCTAVGLPLVLLVVTGCGGWFCFLLAVAVVWLSAGCRLSVIEVLRSAAVVVVGGGCCFLLWCCWCVCLLCCFFCCSSCGCRCFGAGFRRAGVLPLML